MIERTIKMKEKHFMEFLPEENNAKKSQRCNKINN